MSYKLLNGDCLELMKAIPDNSIDLIFTDLPYGQISCKWDCPIDLEKMWIEYLRIKKKNTPIFFTTTTKFGVNLINSAPKKCYFRYDLVWVKSASTGFLSAKKMPLRSHELIYVFYESLPLYDLSSHKHKFKQEYNEFDNKDGAYGVVKSQKGHPCPLYDPPLPTSVVKEELCKYDVNKNVYGGGKQGRIKVPKDKKYHEVKYDPPLPTSVIKEHNNHIKDGQIYNGGKGMKVVSDGKGKQYNPPLPTSVIKEYDSIYNNKGIPSTPTTKHEVVGETTGQSKYDPPLPTSIVEIKSQRGKHSTQKPLDLMKYIFKYYSKEGDMILDNCMGSGSTGVAAIQMNRNFIGIELDKDIFKVAQDRLKYKL